MSREGAAYTALTLSSKARLTFRADGCCATASHASAAAATNRTAAAASSVFSSCSIFIFLTSLVQTLRLAATKPMRSPIAASANNASVEFSPGALAAPSSTSVNAWPLGQRRRTTRSTALNGAPHPDALHCPMGAASSCAAKSRMLPSRASVVATLAAASFNCSSRIANVLLASASDCSSARTDCSAPAPSRPRVRRSATAVPRLMPFSPACVSRASRSSCGIRTKRASLATPICYQI